MIDLDHNATTAPSPAVADAFARALTDHWHNPSSVHRPGQAARHQIELARASLAQLINAKPRDMILCSGGTEAIDLVLRGVLDTHTPPRPAPVLVTTRVEHSAVRELAESLETSLAVRWLPLDAAGRVDLTTLDAILDGATLCSVQWANNETGVIQPIEAIARACRARRVLFHTDATQWVGKEPTDLASMHAAGTAPDALTFSPHKFHGPKGVGVAWVRQGLRLKPQLIGTQELGRRGGTENTPALIAAGVAADEALAWLADPAPRAAGAALRDRFEHIILDAIPDASVNGVPHARSSSPATRPPRLWNTTNLGFPRIEAEALLLMLSERGVNASAGAACSSGSLDPSPVLLAMDIPADIAHGSLRFSLSKHTTAAEIDAAARVVITCVKALRKTLTVTERPG